MNLETSNKFNWVFFSFVLVLIRRNLTFMNTFNYGCCLQSIFIFFLINLLELLQFNTYLKTFIYLIDGVDWFPLSTSCFSFFFGNIM